MLKVAKLAVYLIIGLALASNARAVYSPDQYTVALWHFDECSGDNAFDSSGNGNTGTLSNVEWTTDSISGCAVKFNGIDSIINAMQNIPITHQVTLEAWIKRNSDTSGTIISRNGPFYLAINPDVYDGYRFPINGTVRAGVFTDNSVWHEFSSNNIIPVGQWTHVAMTYDGTRLRIFINGVEDSSIPVSGGIAAPNSGPSFGWGECGHCQYFDGLMDEARISNVARTSFDLSTTTTTIPPTTRILYEDFTGGLDTDKWFEIPASDLNNDLLPEHHVNFNEENIPYHTASRDPADRGVILVSKRMFLPGESIEYDVLYHPDSSSGNRINVVDIDGVTRLYGLFGYWNGIEPAGNDYGLYHVKVMFTNTGADLGITKPDGGMHTRTFLAGTQNHTFGFGTRTGHNGWVHMDYDNFYLTSPFITQTTTTSTSTTSILPDFYTKAEVDALLAEKFAERDARIAALESRASLLETALSNIRNTLTTLQDTVSNIFTSLFGLPKGLRQQMVCEAMIATNQTSASGFGLTCSLNDKGACSCS